MTEISPPYILTFPPELPWIRGADKSLARPGRKQAIATEDFGVHISYLRESNGKLPLRTCPGCSVPEPYRSPDWALIPAQTSPRAEY